MTQTKPTERHHRTERRQVIQGYADKSLVTMLTDSRRIAAFNDRAGIVHAMWCGVIRAEMQRRARTGFSI